MDFPNKYRPQVIEDVIGQEPVVTSIKALAEGEFPHAFLFDGPSGVGKTTLARIIATEFLGCPVDRIMEVDGATFSGADSAREIIKRSAYTTLGADSTVIIIDECHAMSRQAWQVLLKTIEEPSEDTYFMFCTTEIAKVPKTIKTRCHSYTLVEVEYSEICDLLEWIAKEESLRIAKGVVELCAQEAFGSVREAIVNLSKCRNAESKDDARDLLQREEGRPEVIDLCRLIANADRGDAKAAFTAARKLMKDIPDLNAEGARIVICVYFSKVLLNATPQNAMNALAVLDVFSGKVYNPAEKLAPLLLDVADALGVE